MKAKWKGVALQHVESGRDEPNRGEIPYSGWMRERLRASAWIIELRLGKSHRGSDRGGSRKAQ